MVDKMKEWLKVLAGFIGIGILCAILVVGCMAELGFRWGFAL